MRTPLTPEEHDALVGDMDELLQRRCPRCDHRERVQAAAMALLDVAQRVEVSWTDVAAYLAEAWLTRR